MNVFNFACVPSTFVYFRHVKHDERKNLLKSNDQNTLSVLGFYSDNPGRYGRLVVNDKSLVKIVEALDAQDQTNANDPVMIRFRAKTKDGDVEEILSYNQLLERIESEDGENDEWKFTSIDA